MAKATTKLNAQDRVILFCAATGIDHAPVGIVAQAMQSMAVRGFIVHNRETGTYALMDSGRATLKAILEDAGAPCGCPAAAALVHVRQVARPVNRPGR